MAVKSTLLKRVQPIQNLFSHWSSGQVAIRSFLEKCLTLFVVSWSDSCVPLALGRVQTLENLTRIKFNYKSLKISEFKCQNKTLRCIKYHFDQQLKRILTGNWLEASSRRYSKWSSLNGIESRMGNPFSIGSGDPYYCTRQQNFLLLEPDKIIRSGTVRHLKQKIRFL